MQFARYALYYVPPPDPAWVQFATSWLGWDMQASRSVDHPHLPDLPMNLADITQAPRKYGLHGTLKPPFRLAPGLARSDLESVCAELANSLHPLPLGPLRLTRLGRFLALCPAGSPELSTLAADCVRTLDPMRALPSQDELDRRHHAGLTPLQQKNLKDWDYPHVMDGFRFHITLTGRLPKPNLSAVEQVLEQTLMPLMPDTICLTNLALTGEDASGNFHLLRRFELSD